MARRNALVILEHTTAFPFRLRGQIMTCVYCEDTFGEPQYYRLHMADKHTTFNVKAAVAHYSKTLNEYVKVDITELSCRKCGQNFDTLNNIARHLVSEHDLPLNLDNEIGVQPFRLGADRWYCYVCNSKFPNLFKLARHVTTHYLKCTCHICGRPYLTSGALKYHIKFGHNKQPICRKCGKVFKDENEKKVHVSESSRCWNFCCIYCGERFKSWEIKQKHLMLVHQKPQVQYSCPDCDKTFEGRRLFYRHYKIVHTGDSFNCTKCDLVFESRKVMNDHMLRHTGEKLFECNICMKMFARKKSLTQHMWIHSENKRFLCSICNKQYAQKVCLKGHMKSNHPEVKQEL